MIKADPFTWASYYLIVILHIGLSLMAMGWIMHMPVVVLSLAGACPEVGLTTCHNCIGLGDHTLLWVFLSITEASLMWLSICFLLSSSDTYPISLMNKDDMLLSGQDKNGDLNFFSVTSTSPS